MFGGVRVPRPPQHGDTVLQNDLWIGDEAMLLGGVTIANGGVIGARSLVPAGLQTEPYGIYQGNPARLMGFRFGEKLREALLELAWWEQPFEWVRQYAEFFALDLAEDEGRALEAVQELLRERAASSAEPV